MALLISDSSVLIDFIDGGLIERLFRLADEIATPEALYIKELEDHYPDLPAMGLKLIDYDSEDWLGAIRDFKTRYRGTSDIDLLALLIAKQQGCPLVTGDKKLRQAAEQELVEIKGTLSLVEAMVVGAIITVTEAKMAYKLMHQAGSRLPWKLIEEQIEQLSHFHPN